jgi:hypothetical protein
MVRFLLFGRPHKKQMPDAGPLEYPCERISMIEGREWADRKPTQQACLLSTKYASSCRIRNAPKPNAPEFENAAKDRHNIGQIQVSKRNSSPDSIVEAATICTRCRLLHCHSTVSSTIANKPLGAVKSSVFNVFRLMTNSNLAGASTGRSLGLAPLRMRPAKIPTR